MPAQIAVIDNDSLNFLTKMERTQPIFPILRSVFQGIHVPLEVKSEFEKNMPKDEAHERVLKQIGLSNAFLRLCTTFDVFSKMLLENVAGIDPGEAEAFAQYKKISAHFIISDDRKFTEAIKKQDSSVRVINTVLLIAWLDRLGLLRDAKTQLQTLYKVRSFSESQLRHAYKEATRLQGQRIRNKELQRLTNFKILGIK